MSQVEKRSPEQEKPGPLIRPVYKMQKFCDDFGICPAKAYLEVKAGRLRTFKVGSNTCIAGEDALAWRSLYYQPG